jgi:hypothetical protein
LFALFPLKGNKDRNKQTDARRRPLFERSDPGRQSGPTRKDGISHPAFLVVEFLPLGLARDPMLDLDQPIG